MISGTMTEERRKELHENYDLNLTKEELEEGYRFCCEFDGLLIHKSDYEAEVCPCLIEQKRYKNEN
jgi:hypothetical protein